MSRLKSEQWDYKFSSAVRDTDKNLARVKDSLGRSMSLQTLNEDSHCKNGSKKTVRFEDEVLGIGPEINHYTPTPSYTSGSVDDTSYSSSLPAVNGGFGTSSLPLPGSYRSQGLSAGDAGRDTGTRETRTSAAYEPYKYSRADDSVSRARADALRGGSDHVDTWRSHHSSLDGSTASLPVLQQRIENQSKEIDSLRSMVKRLESEKDVKMSQVQTLQDDVNRLSRQMSSQAGGGRASSLVEATEQLRRELRVELASLRTELQLKAGSSAGSTGSSSTYSRTSTLATLSKEMEVLRSEMKDTCGSLTREMGSLKARIDHLEHGTKPSISLSDELDYRPASSYNFKSDSLKYGKSSSLVSDPLEKGSTWSGTTRSSYVSAALDYKPPPAPRKEYTPQHPTSYAADVSARFNMSAAGSSSLSSSLRGTSSSPVPRAVSPVRPLSPTHRPPTPSSAASAGIRAPSPVLRDRSSSLSRVEDSTSRLGNLRTTISSLQDKINVLEENYERHQKPSQPSLEVTSRPRSPTRMTSYPDDVKGLGLEGSGARTFTSAVRPRSPTRMTTFEEDLSSMGLRSTRGFKRYSSDVDETSDDLSMTSDDMN